ncbi:hypothetical protein D3C73_1411190 [compost metagenome]
MIKIVVLRHIRTVLPCRFRHLVIPHIRLHALLCTGGIRQIEDLPLIALTKPLAWLAVEGGQALLLPFLQDLNTADGIPVLGVVIEGCVGLSKLVHIGLAVLLKPEPGIPLQYRR